MKRKRVAIFTMAILLMLTIAAFAQSSGQSGQESRPGPGYSSEPGYDYGPGYGCWGYGMGPAMMGPGWGYGYGMGPWMMGPGWWRGRYYSNATPEERETRAKDFVESYVQRYLPGYKLEKESGK